MSPKGHGTAIVKTHLQSNPRRQTAPKLDVL